MKTLVWICAGISLSIVAYVILNEPETGNATDGAKVNGAAAKTLAWASRQRVAGTAGKLGGKLKQGVGKAVRSDDLAGEGVIDEVAGTVKEAAGQVAHGTSDAPEDLAR